VEVKKNMQSIQREAKMHLLERRALLTPFPRDIAQASNTHIFNEGWQDLSAYARDAAVLDELSGAELRELREVDAVLQRLKKGTYGCCERCGAAIKRRRLRAIPEARKCLRCELPAELGWAAGQSRPRPRLPSGTARTLARASAV
jgi:RNA polymerase-binding transcription factor DksA